MKRRILSAFLIIVMLISLMPITAFAWNTQNGMAQCYCGTWHSLFLADYYGDVGCYFINSCCTREMKLVKSHSCGVPCDVCGLTLEHERGTDPSEMYSDENGCGMGCRYCGTPLDYAPHQGEYVVPWYTDEQYHYDECIRCMKKCNPQPHSYGELFEIEGCWYKMCDYCGYYTSADTPPAQEEEKPPFEWSYNESSGVLTITGDGNIPDYEKGEAPWYDLQFKVYSVNIGEGIKSIGKGAFAYMYYVRSLSLPDSLEKIGTNAFYYCMSLEEVLIPEKVSTIGGGVFSYCLALESISLPASVTKINPYTFYDCKKLSNIYYAASQSDWAKVNTLEGNSCFKNATAKTDTVAGTNWSYQDGTLTIGGYGRMENYTSKTAPWNEYTNDIRKIVVQEGVTGIGNYAFGYCFNVTEIQLPDSLVHIGSNVFHNCMSLETLDIPEGVRRIYGAAFNNCKKLNNITIPQAIDTIYNHTFLGCSSLTNVSYNGTDAQWQKIKVLANNEALLGSEINYLISSVSWTLTEDGTLTVSGDKMDNYELRDAPLPPWHEQKDSIKKVVVADGMTNIGKNAFYNCKNLKEVEISESVTTIDYGAFMGCSALESITLPDNLTYLGSAAFNGCKALKSIIIPAGIKNIYSYTFYECNALESASYAGNSDKLSIVLAGNNSLLRVI